MNSYSLIYYKNVIKMKLYLLHLKKIYKFLKVRTNTNKKNNKFLKNKRYNNLIYHQCLKSKHSHLNNIKTNKMRAKMKLTVTKEGAPVQ